MPNCDGRRCRRRLCSGAGAGTDEVRPAAGQTPYMSRFYERLFRAALWFTAVFSFANGFSLFRLWDVETDMREEAGLVTNVWSVQQPASILRRIGVCPEDLVQT